MFGKRVPNRGYQLLPFPFESLRFFPSRVDRAAIKVLAAVLTEVLGDKQEYLVNDVFDGPLCSWALVPNVLQFLL